MSRLLEQVVLGQTVVVHAGESIPFDGHIVNGFATVDQHMLTGETHLQEKVVGDEIFSSTLVVTGKAHICVNKTGKDTAAAQITGDRQLSGCRVAVIIECRLAYCICHCYFVTGEISKSHFIYKMAKSAYLKPRYLIGSSHTNVYIFCDFMTHIRVENQAFPPRTAPRREASRIT